MSFSLNNHQQSIPRGPPEKVRNQEAGRRGGTDSFGPGQYHFDTEMRDSSLKGPVVRQEALQGLGSVFF
jgi:hypothetical protein